MKVRIRAGLVTMIAALALFGGAGAAHVSQTFAQDATPTATPITTGNLDILGISPAICFLLVASDDSLAAPACHNLDQAASLLQTADFLGNGDGEVQPSDFSGIDLDANQVHQMDDFTGPQADNGSLYIMVWVHNQTSVTFSTNRGVFVPVGYPASPGGPHPTVDDVAQDWVCDNQKGAAHLALLEDADCGAGFGTGDGVVVARLRARYGSSIADFGPGTVSVRQGIVNVATISFRVVGEPRKLEFVTLESTIQTGQTDPQNECKLPTTAAGFLEANSNPQKAIVLARALDIEGNSITGALVLWEPKFATDVDGNKIINADTITAGMAAPLTPTLDLGSFGFGAPNIICGTTEPGTVEVVARGSAIAGDLLLIEDPQATETVKRTSFVVVGDPASITATAAPAAIACDGTQTSTVTATVLDANGDPVTSGNDVHFDVQVLGTANPVNGKTSGEGVVASVISPLAIGSTGVPVTVSIGDIATSVRIDCTVAAPAPPPAPAGGGAPSGGGAGVISGPDTGTGDALAGAGSGLSVWAYALLALGAIALSAGSMLAAARTRNR